MWIARGAALGSSLFILWLAPWIGLWSTLAERGPAAAPLELRMDVDGDGRPERVRISRNDDGYWADVWLDGARGARLLSATRILACPGPAAAELTVMDVNGDGREDLVVR